MPRIDVTPNAGMVTNPEDGKFRPGDVVLAQNVTYENGPAQGRRAMRNLYSSNASRPVAGIGRFLQPGGAEHVVVAVYSADKGYPILNVQVFRGMYEISNPPDGVEFGCDSFQRPVNMVQFGDSMAIVGNGAIWQTGYSAPVSMIRCRFARDKPEIAELVPFDRTTTPYFSGDDQGPYRLSPPAGRALCAFQYRLFLLGLAERPDALAWSNLDDLLGYPAGNYLSIAGGRELVAAAPLRKRLLVASSSYIKAVRGDFASANGTLVEDVTNRFGCSSSRGLVDLGNGVAGINHEGVFLIEEGGARYISDAIHGFLTGRMPTTWASELARWTPTPESLTDAPGVWLPRSRQLIFALSNGFAITGNPGCRNVWVVGHLPESGKVRWSIWTFDALTACGESLLAYVDPHGRETLLAGTVAGRVHIAHTGGRDYYYDDSGSNLVTSRLVFAPFTLNQPDPVVFRELDVAWVDMRDRGTGGLTVSWPQGIPDGNFDGALTTDLQPPTVDLPTDGDAITSKLVTSPVTRTKVGIPGDASEFPGIALSATPLGAIVNVAVQVDNIGPDGG